MDLARFNPLWAPTRRRRGRDWWDSFFESALEPWFRESEGFGDERFVPAVDIRETDDKYLIEAELPGIKKEDVHIEVKDGVLTIRGERKHEEEKKEGNYTRIERAYGQFQRTFTLPVNVEEEKIDAAFKDGILTVELPKGEKAKPKQIEIKTK